jgi:DNA-binding MarR family transcriptional regulator
MKSTDILISIRKIVRTIHLESKRIDKQFGVSMPQLLALGFLQEQADCKATPKQLKLFLQLNASTVTGIIQRLITKGLIIKMDNPSDKRAPFIVLSVAGERLLNNSPELMHEKLTRKLNKMTPDKLETLRLALATIEDLMEIDDDSSDDHEIPVMV